MTRSILAALPAPRRRGRLATAALAALLASALAACTAIPDAGPVREGLSRLDQYERSVLFTPSGPVRGASQEEIVRDFVRAASSAAGDYEIAREFLAPTYAEQWDPWMGVLIDQGTQQYEASQEGHVRVSLRVAATVDSRGQMSVEPQGNTTDVQFELTRIAGEWRISSAPNGIILDRNTFQAAWIARQIYFLSADGRLVPETRWFLNRQTLPTQIVRELLYGPSPQMSMVAHTAAPAGTTLLSGSVPVADGVASIDLSVELFDADEKGMELLKRQLAASLQGLSGVLRFELLVHGAVVERAPVAVPEDTTPASEHQFVSVLKNGQFGVAMGEDEVRPIAGLGERITALSPIAVTVSPDRSTAAVLHAGGVSFVSTTETVLIDASPGLREPSLDALGYVWVYDPAWPDEISASRPGQQPIVLKLPWLEGRKPVIARVSMGANRLALLVEANDETEVLLAGIVRDQHGEPVTLTDTATVQLRAQGVPVDLDWIGETRFAALTGTGLLGTTRRVTIGVVGNFPQDSGSVPGGAHLSGGGGSRALLRVLDDQHRMYAPQGSGWQLQQSGVELLAKVG